MPKANGHLVGLTQNEPPPTEYAIVELERAESGDFVDGLFDLEKAGEAILQSVDGTTLAAHLQARGQTEPGSKITIKFYDGSSAVYKNLTPLEEWSGKTSCIWRSNVQDFN